MSTNGQDSRPGTPRKRSESVAVHSHPESMSSVHGGLEGRDRSQSVTQPEGPQGQLPSTGFDTVDRVFPIRSVVSVDRKAADQAAQARSAVSPTREGAMQYPIIDTQTWNELQSQSSHPRSEPGPTIPTDTIRHETHATDDTTELAAHSMASHVNQHPETYAQEKSESQSGSTTTAMPGSYQTTRPNEPFDHVTARFTHVITDSGHAVITGRDGKSFQYCEDEPIRVPGAIQSFGVMIAMREEAPNKLVVRVVSENSEQLMGYTPKQLFEVDNFCDILGDEQADTLLDHVDFVRDDAYDPSVDGPEVFILTIRTPSGEKRRFWCAAHVSPSQKDLIICEFELEEDELNPLNVDGQATPATPADTMGTVPTPEQFAASTVNISQPLRVLRNARRRRGEAAAMDVFSIFTQVQEQLGRAKDLNQLLNTTAGLVKELTGFHRVLIYQFDSSWNGLVVAELVDPKVTIDLYKGLHFPASDIPAQARELYKINKVRLLYDRDHVTSRLVCRTLEDLESPLDMTHAFLRAMSPIHVKYLGHMQVRSSMSISVNAFNDLWGLISCHSYGTAGMRVSFPIRKMCRLLGDTVSRNIERLSYASRLQARKLINTVPTEANPSGYIIASSDDLLQLFDADYGALSIRDETKILGDNAHSQEVLALLEFIRMRQINSVLASHDIIKDFPDLHYGPGLKAISGLLYVPLSTGGSDFICFFRKGQLTEIKWAGNPYEIAKRKETAGYLEPRESFTAWQETVLSQSREWSESDVETAAVLCLVYGKFIKVWRQKEAAMQNSQLTRLLLANSAHEVRTPLNAIINYLEIALEGALDTETRESLTKSHSASKSLIYVINDLLDLTNTETGQALIKDEAFDLKSTLQEAFDMLSGEAKRKNIAFSITIQPGIPPKVIGDQRRIRQVFSNIISNAIQQTASGAVIVDMWRSANQDTSDHIAVEMMVVDTGAGMSKTKLEALFSELEQVSTENYEGEDEKQLLDDQPQQQRVLGLGLALVARIVYSMKGQLGVKSEEGKGSRFKVILQFGLPDGSSVDTPTESNAPPHANIPPTPMISDQEFTLPRGGNEPREARREDRRRSSESLRSGGSSRSGRSHADRLISAMQEPPLLKRAPSETSEIHRFRHSTSPQSTGYLQSSVGSPSNSHQRLSSKVQQDPLATLSTVTHTPPLTLQPMLTPPIPGTENIRDSGVPMGPVRISERKPKHVISYLREQSYFPLVSPQPADPCETISTVDKSSTTSASMALSNSQPLRVLVAEDDPINSKIIHKRLTKLGHTVELTGNGEACATAFSTQSGAFDVVLMDIQMPIADGYAATQMIREFESKAGLEALSNIARGNSRIPIFAVSASLLESERQKYIDTGFDGWVMKPISFSRLNVLFGGIFETEAKEQATYQPGHWEIGGWF
ncbi:CheY-like superfamily [Penicillium verhagenii]|nr:CheY-like superfamily [Penicillium verhagenii]